MKEEKYKGSFCFPIFVVKILVIELFSVVLFFPLSVLMFVYICSERQKVRKVR